MSHGQDEDSVDCLEDEDSAGGLEGGDSAGVLEGEESAGCVEVISSSAMSNFFSPFFISHTGVEFFCELVFYSFSHRLHLQNFPFFQNYLINLATI